MDFNEKLRHLVSYYGVGGLYLKRNYKKGRKLEEMLDDLGIPRGRVEMKRIIDEAIRQNKYKYLGVSDWNASEKVVKAYINELRKKGVIDGYEAESLRGRWKDGATRIVYGVSVDKTPMDERLPNEKPDYRLSYKGFNARLSYSGRVFNLPCWELYSYGFSKRRQGCFDNPMDALLSFKRQINQIKGAESFNSESHTDRMARLNKQIEDAQEEIENIKYCNHQTWKSINKNIGCIDENSFSLTIECADCGSHGVAEWENPTFISWDRTYLAESYGVEFNDWAEQEMLTHGEDISFKKWAKDESEKHGDMDLEDWAEHEEQSHDERYGAERYWDKDTDSYREIYNHSIEVREFPKSSSVYQNGKLVKQYKGQGHFINATAYAQKLENDYVPKSFFAEGKRREVSELVCFKCGVKDEQANYNWNTNAKGCCGMGVREKRYYINSENMTSKLKSPYVIGAFVMGLGLPYISSFLNSKKDK